MIFAISPKTCQDPKIYRLKDYSSGLDIFLIFKLGYGAGLPDVFCF